MRNFKRIWMTLLLALAVVISYVPMSMTAYAEAGDTPPHTKNVTDNQDGTYTISLDIVGESEKKPNNVNVIVIFDRSGSMGQPNNWQGQPTNGRLNAAKTAVNNLANSLFAYNTTDAPNTVQMALVDFSTTATSRTPTNSYDTFSGQVNSLSASGGTNWEDALQDAANVNFGDDDQTFVIFVSDGNPTFRNTRGSYNPMDDAYYGNPYNYGVYGNGSDSQSVGGISAATTISRCYNHAVDDAQALVDSVGADHFFTIGAYGNVDRMEDLTDDAGSDSSTNYYSAADTTALNQAMSDILAKIETVGFADAEIDDGTTNNVTTSSGDVAKLLELVPNFKYYRSGGTYGSMQEWTDAPEAEIVDGEVVWDLSDEGVLENGVRYTVTFDCYPSQETYDIIAQLKNGDMTDADLAEQGLDKYIVKQGNDYALRTNTNAGIKWDDTRDDEGPQTDSYKNPDPVATSADSLTIEKKWEPEGEAPENTEVPITVMMGNEEFHTSKVSAANGWKDSAFISVGIIKGDEALPGAMGHDFSFAELDDTQYHWEIDAPIVRPMLINGGGKDHTPTMLIKVDAKHPAPSGATTYTIDGSTYYVDEATTGLTATNYRRSNLNLTKVVTGEDAPEDATFPFTLKVNNPKAPESEPTDDPDHNSDYWLWFSIWDNDANAAVMDATVSGDGLVGPSSDGSYYLPAKNAVTVEMKANWNLRFFNVPSGTTYEFTEGDLPEGFAFNKSELTQGEDSTFSGAQTTTGTIENTKTSYYVTYTNDYALTDLEITKVWNDNGDQDGKRLTPDKLKEKLTLSPEVEGAEATIVDNGDDTYTITYTGLPRFNNGQEVEYTVAESAIDGYTTTGSPAKDHGTITNTHEIEKTSITVNKVWVGPEAEAEITLKAGNDTVGTVTLPDADGKNTYTWTNLDKYKDGQAIKYSVTEAAIANYSTSGPTGTGTEDDPFEFTNTNTETVDVEVTKAWSDNSDQDGIRPDTLTLTLNGAPTGTTVADPTITKSGNNWKYKWTGLPKYDPSTGELCEYTVTEGTVPEGYQVSGSPAQPDGTITNTHNVEKTSITVNKVWVGPEAEAEITLKAGNDTVGTVTLPDEEGNNTYTWTNLDKNKNGQEIVYTVTEAAIENYSTSGPTGTGTEDDPFEFTNTNTETVDVEVTKAWSDNSDQDGIRPDTLTLTLNGAPTGTTVADPTITKSGNNWKYKWTGLPKYDPSTGELCEYTVTEGTVPEGYQVSGSPAQPDGTITNTHTPEETSVTVTKSWDDNSDQDGKRPDALALTLLANDTAVADVTPTIAKNGNNWTYTWSNLDKYADGEEIIYTVSEDSVPTGYSVSGSPANAGGTITNTHVTEKTKASVEKNWVGDKADNRPEKLTVELLADEVATGTTKELTAANGWKASVEGLEKFRDGGVAIQYSWKENDLPAYYQQDGIDTTSTADGFVTTISNRIFAPVEVDLNGKKVLEGRNLQAGEFTFKLTGPKNYVDTKENAKDGTFAFDTLKFETPGTYEYKIVEVKPENPKPHVSYDTTEYTVTIKVDPGTGENDGKLVATVNGGDPAEFNAEFTNIYEPQPTSVTMLGKKILNGQTLEAKKFKFNISGEWEALEGDSEPTEEATPEAEKEETADEPAEKKAADESAEAEKAADEAEKAADEAEKAADEAKEEAKEAAEELKEAEKALAEAEENGDEAEVEAAEKAVAAAEATAEEAKEEAKEAEKAADEAADKAADAAEAAGESDKAPAFDVTPAAEAAKEVVTKAADVVAPDPENGTSVWNGEDPDGAVSDVNFGKITFNAEGKYTYTITEDESSLPPGVKNITEEEQKVVIVVKYDKDKGEYYVESITPSDAPRFTFTNEYTPTPGKADLEFKKEFVGHSMKAGDFEFTLKNEKTGKTLTAKNAADGTVKFEGIEFAEPGNYNFTLTEVTGKSDAIIYDTSVKSFAATVTDSNPGEPMTVTWNDKAKNIVFKNTYDSTVWIDPPVQKVVKGSPKKAETYTFLLEADDPSFPMPDEANGESSMTMSIKGTGAKEFGVILFTEPGTYSYTVTEVEGDNDNCEYDGSVYKVTVVVTEDENYVLHKEVTYTKDDEEYDTAVFKFVNTYEEEKPPHKPDTGDTNDLAGMLALMTSSAAGLVYMFFRRRRKEYL